MGENTKAYTNITMDFTADEVVTLLSCCNHAIINIENKKYDGIGITAPLHNGITLEGSLEKIWEIKTKLKKSIISSLAQSTKNNISVTMDITEYIKLNGCCNSAIESEENMIDLLPPTCNSIKICNANIQLIMAIKCKIKAKINSVYGNTLLP